MFARTAVSWSPKPGTGSQLTSSPGRFVSSKSRKLFFLVGKFVICEREFELQSSINSSFTLFGYWLLCTACFSQSISGRLKSPPNHSGQFLNLLHKSLILTVKSE